MGNAVGDVLPLAIGVAISPVPIIAVILMLFSARARSNGPAFAAGWILGLAIVGGIVLAIAGTQDLSSDNGASKVAALIKLLLGLLLLGLAAGQWRKRPKPGEAPHVPKWMAAIDSFTPGKALGLAVLLSAVNPKNLTLTLGASLDIANANLSTGEAIGTLIVFIVVGSVTVVGPVLYYLLAGNRAAKLLDTWKAWLTQNNATVMFVLLLVMGTVLVGKGIGGLAG
jgi:hypothetical protein